MDFTGEEIPRAFRHVEIEYSKFGVEDFDFGYGSLLCNFKSLQPSFQQILQQN